MTTVWWPGLCLDLCRAGASPLGPENPECTHPMIRVIGNPAVTSGWSRLSERARPAARLAAAAHRGHAWPDIIILVFKLKKNCVIVLP